MNTEDSNSMKEHVREYGVNNLSFPQKRIIIKGEKSEIIVICMIRTVVPEGQIHNMFVIAHVSFNNKIFWKPSYYNPC